MKSLRKIHLWLSVPFGIFITLICFSGAAMVYEKEITEWVRQDIYRVNEVGAEALPLDRLMEIAEENLPDSVEISGVTVFPDSGRTYQVSLSKPRRASMFVDQYTGEVKGHYSRLPFFDTVFHLHRWLLGDLQEGKSVGKLIVGVSTLALVFILVTGILMWLTNRRKPLKMSLTISVTKGWKRFLHDLHVAGGIYATTFLLISALTGLTWSFEWYRSGFFSLLGAENSVEETHSGESGHDRSHGNAGRRSHSREEGSYEGGRRRGHHGRRVSKYACWETVLENVAALNPNYRQITIKADAAEVVPEGRASLRATDKYSYDPHSGEITGVQPYSQTDRASKVRGAVYVTHVGSWGGCLTRLIIFLSALIGATLPLTGYWLWIRRLTRKGNEGA